MLRHRLAAARDERGVSAIEYAILAGLIAVVSITLVTLTGGALSGTYSTIAAEISGTAVEPVPECWPTSNSGGFYDNWYWVKSEQYEHGYYRLDASGESWSGYNDAASAHTATFMERGQLTDTSRWQDSAGVHVTQMYQHGFVQYLEDADGNLVATDWSTIVDTSNPANVQVDEYRLFQAGTLYTFGPDSRGNLLVSEWIGAATPDAPQFGGSTPVQKAVPPNDANLGGTYMGPCAIY